MRIDFLDLIRYGHFSNRQISFRSTQPDFHVIYGENEAGKSTLLRAISSLLFGVPSSTPDVHTFKGSELRIGGTLSEPGRPFSFRRRKGVTGTLLDLADSQIPDAALQPFLRELDRDRFEQFFGLDHERLREGGEELLRGKGDVGSALFQASGLLDLTKMLEHLNEEAKELFSAKSKGKVIGLALEEYKQALAEVKRLAISASEVKEKEAQLQSAMRKHEELRDQIHALNQQQIRLRRIAGNKPDIANLQKLRASLSDLQSVPSLPADSRRRRDDAMKALADADHQIHRLMQQIADRKQRIQELPSGPLYKTHGAEIDLGNAGIHDYVRSINDRPKRERDRYDAIHLAEQEWREVHAWRKRPVLDAEGLRGAYAGKSEIRELITAHALLTSYFEEADERASAAKADHQRLIKQLALSPDQPDPAILTATLEAAKSLGDIEGAVTKLSSEAKRMSADIERDLKRLPFATDIEQLAALKVPLISTIERYSREWDSIETRHREIASRKASLEESVRNTQEELEKSGRKITGYAENELLQSRSRRDDLLKLLESSFLGNLSAIEAQAKSESAEPLPGNLRRHLRRSDEIADLRFVHAGAAAIHDRLVKQLESTRAQLATIEQEAACMEDEVRQLQKRWAKQWISLECDPLSPAEMKEWMHLRQGMLEQLEHSREKQNELRELEARAAAAADEVCGQLKALRLDAKLGKEPLSVLIKLGEGIAKDIEAERTSIHEVRRALDLLDLDAREKRLSECKSSLSKWAAMWAPQMSNLLLPETTTPQDAGEALDILERVFRHLDKANDMQYRIKRIGDNVSEFEEKVSKLVIALDSNLAGTAPDAAASQLHTRYIEMGKADTKRAEMESQNEADEVSVDEYRATARTASVTLNGLRRAANCEGDAALEVIIRAAEERAEKQAEYDRITRSLIDRNGVSDLQQIEQEAAGTELDVLKSEIAAADERLQSIQSDAVTAGIEAGRFEDELRRLQNSEESSLQAQKAEAALAKARPAIAQYLRLRLASELLQESIESYRQKHQGPVLTRASELFSQLTLGDHSGLTTSFGDDDKPILVAIRKNREHVEVAGLSDGTRDQLYLALRLARIEQHIASVAACPVILDDILINSDDVRASAALDVFAGLAARTQVLLFTHHSRIVELAVQAGAQRIDLESSATAAVA